MTNSTDPPPIINSPIHTQTLNTNQTHLITINVSAQAPLKLTSSNYISWKLQFETLFIGYDLLGYIDGSKACPAKTITQNQISVSNPAYQIWIRQDKLILNAIIGSLSPEIIPFVATAKTSQEAWSTLANTYAKPSRGRIKQIKNKLKTPSKGTMSITEFIHSIKAHADELAILGAPMDEEDLTDKILDGLGDEYKELVRAVQARDNPISFEELHEKLLTFETTITSSHSTNLPITANHTQRANSTWRPPNTWKPPHSANNWRPSFHQQNRTTYYNNNGRPHNTTPPSSRGPRPPPKPYLGYCQICGIQGHTAKRCQSYQIIPISPGHQTTNSNTGSSNSWKPQAQYASNITSFHQPWLLDTGASHHITTDLANLSLHQPYTGNDDVMIGDGTGHQITHTGPTDGRNTHGGRN